MWITVEDIDGSIYADAILSPADLQRVRQGEMVTAQVIFKRRKCYAGVRLQGAWDFNEEGNEGTEKDWESDARI